MSRVYMTRDGEIDSTPLLLAFMAARRQCTTSSTPTQALHPSRKDSRLA